MATCLAVHPQRVAMARVISDCIETLGAHGLRRTDQTRAAHAVMMLAIAASIGALRAIMAISNSIIGLVPYLFHVGK